MIQDVKEYVPPRQRGMDPYSTDSGLSPSMSHSNHHHQYHGGGGHGSHSGAGTGDDSPRSDTGSGSQHRKMLRKEQLVSDDDGAKGRKRFSRRHSKNGLAAVF